MAITWPRKRDPERRRAVGAADRHGGAAWKRIGPSGLLTAGKKPTRQQLLQEQRRSPSINNKTGHLHRIQG